MEEILPFLAGLAYMGYKIYDNFQKGQEEARQRNPSNPVPQERTDYSEWFEDEQPYSPKSILDKDVSPERSPETKYEPVYQKNVAEQPYREPAYKAERSSMPAKVELYNPEVPAAEVLRNRRIHESHNHKFEAHAEEEHPYADFDFKDAIIKEAILNRPQY